jgi:hypothetical protein
VHGLAELGLVDADAISDVMPYVPLLDSIESFDHPMMAGLRPNASQLVESPSLGYEIIGGLTPDEGAPTDLYAAMTVVDPAAWIEIGGEQIATTEGGVAVGQASIGAGQIRLVAGALPMPTEGNDHRYGLRNYAMTYTGLYIMENAIVYEAAGLGTAPTEVAGVTLEGSAPKSALPTTGGGAVLLSLMLLGGAILARRRHMTV